MSLRETLSERWFAIQDELFPVIEAEVGPLGERYQMLVSVLELTRVEALVEGRVIGRPGRPKESRAAIARSFLAKAVFGIPTTKDLVERLKIDHVMRRLCGWRTSGLVPSEATFSRAFAEFATAEIAQRLHEKLTTVMMKSQLVCHLSRDATAIHARETPVKKPPKPEKPKRKRGRPRKDEVREPPPPKRLDLQPGMTLEEALADLPKPCDKGTKKNSKGYKESWNGYKLHLDVSDGGIPISGILTSASVHDSQVAIPLAMMSAQRCESLYDLMDKAYDAQAIRNFSVELGHVPIIDVNPRSSKRIKAELDQENLARRNSQFTHPQTLRKRERSTAERVNGRLKDSFGGRYIYVRGHAKVSCHLMFGVTALTVDQMMRYLL